MGRRAVHAPHRESAGGHAERERCLTTFIVGFPGETEEEFEALIDFTKQARLDRVGAFVFSREPGTPSHDMEGQISTRVKRERYDRLMRTQQRISLQVNQQWVGKELDVLIEDERDGWLIGRSHRDAPEIDGLVFVQGDAPMGRIVRAKIVDAEAYDLHARVGALPATRSRSLTQLRQAAPSQPL